MARFRSNSSHIAGSTNLSREILLHLEQTRDDIANRILLICCLVAGPALLVSMWRLVDVGWKPIFTFHIGAYLSGLAVYLFRDNLSFLFRSIYLLSMFLLGGVLSVFQWGVMGSANLALLFTCTLGALLFGRNVCLLMICTSVGAILLAHYAASQNLILVDLDPVFYLNSYSAWLTAAASIAFFAGIILAIQGRLQFHLLRYLQQLRDQTRQTQLEQAQRTRAESDLMHSEARFQTLVDTMNDGLVELRADATFSYVNHSLCKMLGYSEKELLNQDALVHFDKPNREIVLAQLAKRISGGSKSYEVAFTKKDGNLVHTILSPQPRFSAQGEYLGSIAVVTDITERKRMEIELAENERKYRQLFDNAQAGLYRVRISDGVFLACNPRFSQILGYDNPKQALSEGNASDHFPDPEVREDLVSKIRSLGVIDSVELPLAQKGGETIWVRCSLKANLKEDYWEGVVLDITEEKRAQAARQRAYDDLEYQVIKQTRELKKAQNDVKQLSGLLPICSACKKIRNSEDYWQQVDQYIAQHTDAIFTHSICPECTQKLYPGLIEPEPPDKS